MGVKVEADALTTLERAKRHIGIPEGETKDDTYLIDLINASSGWVRRYTGQPMRQRQFLFSIAGEGLLTGSGGAALFLPVRPCLALSYLVVDTSQSSGYDWYWDTGSNAEAGALRYGTESDNDWTLDQKNSIIYLHNGMLWPKHPIIRVEGVFGLADGTTTTPLPLHANFPHSTSIMASGQSGGRYHQTLGWDGFIGQAIQAKTDELVAWMYRQKERARQGVASTSGEGLTVTYVDGVPKEITTFFDQFREWPI